MWQGLFQAINLVALVAWAALLFGTPRRVVSAVRIGGVGLLCLVYAVLLALLMAGAVDANRAPGPPPSLADYSVAGLRRLFQSDGGIVVGWTHYLALDLLAGSWIALAAADRGWGRVARAPILLLTFLAGPLGVLTWLALSGLGRRSGPVLY